MSMERLEKSFQYMDTYQRLKRTNKKYFTSIQFFYVQSFHYLDKSKVKGTYRRSIRKPAP